MSDFNLDWSDLAFGSKKALRELKAAFIAAPRHMSQMRLKELVKQYLPDGNIIIGIAKEPYVAGLEEQPHFAMLRLADVQPLAAQVNARTSYKIYTLQYFQREAKHLFARGKFKKVVLVNGSWHYAFQNTENYYTLMNAGAKLEFVSPFVDEQEALDYEAELRPKIKQAFWPYDPRGTFTEPEMLAFAGQIAKLSYDYSFQTGVTLGKRMPSGRYKFVAAGFNKVVPFQTYALHYGNARETHFSAPGDLNHYDAVHAETMLLIKAAEEKIDLRGTTVFINLLPCPFCARMFAETPIAEFVYCLDHSDGYAVKLLQKAGKQVRRLVL